MNRQDLSDILVLFAVILFCYVVANMTGCAPARSAQVPYAERITGPAGVDCFVVRDGDGRAVGGSCVRD